MTRGDVARLLALAVEYDKRTVGEREVAAWHLVLADVDYDDAQRAVVAHYTNGGRFVMPSDIVAGARLLVRDRVERTVLPPPDVDPDDVEAWRAALVEQRRQAAHPDQTKAIGGSQ